MAFKLERKRLEELDDYTEVSEETDTVPNSMSITRLNMIDRYINEDSTLKSVLNEKEMKHFIEHEEFEYFEAELQPSHSEAYYR